MKYHAKKIPDPLASGWAVFLNDEQITYYQFEKNEAEALAAAKQKQQEEIIERVLLEE